ncbi:MAG: GNAT family N-acetyltransferase [Anaerolineaceae bacterium]|nr:MAG: GNAT family N-acetyltransferase [Anaerolineaceae bacterium]
MIFQLEPSEYNRVRPFFNEMIEYQLMCSAVLEGDYPGKIYMDDLTSPETVFISSFISSEDDGVWGFLAGEPNNEEFNRALNKAIQNREIISEKAPIVFLTCHPEGWYEQLPTVLHPQQPIPMHRRYYECREFTLDWGTDVPEGYEIRRLDETLLTDPQLKIPDDVIKILNKWRSISDPPLKDFGFVCIRSNRIVSWATIDFISGGVGEAGIFTLSGYRRRGLATIVTAAAVEHGLSHELSQINWTCTEDNHASIRTAEKLGFERGQDYMMYCMIFDEVQHLGNLAYYYLERGDYSEAVEIFEEDLASRDDLPLWAFYDVARGWAGLENEEKMFAYLNTLAERGWTEVESLERCKEFDPWHASPEWIALIDRMRGDK